MPLSLPTACPGRLPGPFACALRLRLSPYGCRQGDILASPLFALYLDPNLGRQAYSGQLVGLCIDSTVHVYGLPEIRQGPGFREIDGCDGRKRRKRWLLVGTKVLDFRASTERAWLLDSMGPGKSHWLHAPTNGQQSGLP